MSEPQLQPDQSEPTVASGQTESAVPDSTTVTDPQPVASVPSTSATKPKEDSETLTQKYMTAFKSRLIALGGSDTEVEGEWKRFEAIQVKLKEENKQFIESQQYKKLMIFGARETEDAEDRSRLCSQHMDIILELRRISLPFEEKSKTKVKNRKRKIKKLTETLKKLAEKISECENDEIDLDDLDNKTSFTESVKLYKRAEKVWLEREKLLKRSTNTQRPLFKKYSCKATTYPEINKCAEDLFNSHLKKLKNKNGKRYVDESFTFIDVRKAILDEIRDKQLAISNTDTMVEQVYEEMLKELKKRREVDVDESMQCFEIYKDLAPEVFVKEDPKIELQCAKNKSYYTNKLDEIYDKYANEDRKQNGESVLQNGVSEWESGPIADNEEFESLDVKEGDLDGEETSDKEEDDSDDEETNAEATPLPDFDTSQPITIDTDSQASGADSQLSTQPTVSMSSPIASSDIELSAMKRSSSTSSSNQMSTSVSGQSLLPEIPAKRPRLSSEEVIDLSDSSDEKSDSDSGHDSNGESLTNGINKSIEVIDIDLTVDELDAQKETIGTKIFIDKKPMNVNTSVNTSVEIIEID